ncbi:IS66 family insertion sequence element accessory protein TnpB [Paraburkholderia sp. WC7.3d]|uniref:IS66 family insertion sequence element accessory protein TnpB n=1 Tax=Paraburkholderia sp. WC7.3d TaxID=2991069 RepID=UPI003D1D6F58
MWIAAGVTDMCSGFPALAAKVQTALEENPLGGDVFIFRGRRGDLVKTLWATDDGLWLLAKRLSRGRFIWPHADGGKIYLTSAQLSMLLEGIDWRQPRRTAVFAQRSARLGSADCYPCESLRPMPNPPCASWHGRCGRIFPARAPPPAQQRHVPDDSRANPCGNSRRSSRLS